jgi:hypothetical protein
VLLAVCFIIWRRFRIDDSISQYFIAKEYSDTERSLVKLNAAVTSRLPAGTALTHRQALQGFPDTSQIPLYKNNKINSPFL